MYILANFLLLGWFFRTSYSLACIQCATPTQRIPENVNNSCLDGTLAPVRCERIINGTLVVYKNCLSALYRFPKQGVHIHRGCSMIEHVRHECEPPLSTIDFDVTLDFFCSQTCSDDGCNQHSIKELSSNSNQDFKLRNRLSETYFIISIQLFVNFFFY